MSKRDILGLGVLFLGVYALQEPCSGDVRLDGSMGPAGPIQGPHYPIFQNQGQTAGGNLFHSFSAFNVGLGEAATFFGAPAIDNVIARVTGGTPSSIDGLVTSAIPGANLWFINPQGVLFGPHASVDVDGSFYVSTANFLRFADGARLETRAGVPPVLSSAPPEAFGFLTDHPAAVGFYGSGSDAAGQALGGYYASRGLHWRGMAVPEGKTFAVVAGNIEIQDGALLDVERVAAKIEAPSGRIALISVGAPGEVKPNTPEVNTSSFAREGKISLSSGVAPLGAQLNASGPGGGEIVIRGGEFVARNAYLVSTTTGGADGKKIDIQVRGDLDLATNGAGVYAGTTGAGKAPDIAIAAGNLRLRDTAAIVSGNGDNSAGKGGRIDIAAGAVNLTAASQVGSYAGKASRGDGGAIRIATGDLTIRGGSAVHSGSGLGGTARGGTVTVKATGTVKLADGTPANQSGIFSNAADGDAGTLSLSARDLVLENGGTIGADNFGAGRGADIVIHAGTVTLSSDGANPNSFAIISAKPSNALGRTPTGAPGNITITADTLRFSGPRSGITSANLGAGAAGAVTIAAGSLEMADGARIEGSTLGRGRASNLRLEADRIELRGGAAVNASSAAEGRAGEVNIVARERLGIEGVSMERRGGIYSVALDSGDAGKIVIRTPKLRIGAYGEISTATAGNGRGGDIQVRDADSVTIEGPGGVFSETLGPGEAGTIDIATGRLSLNGNALITASTQGTGKGGQVRVRANEAITLKNATDGYGSINSVTRGSGRAGKIDIDTPRLDLEGRVTIEATTVSDGDAGDVDIRADSIALRKGAQIGSGSGIVVPETQEIFAGRGNGGTVTIRAGELRISGQATADIRSGIFSQTAGGGRGGSVSVEASRLEMTERGQIGTDTAGDASAGTIEVRAGSARMESGAEISSRSGIEAGGHRFVGRGQGGTIHIVSEGDFVVSGAGTAISTDTQGSGAAGDISVRGRTVRIEGGAALSSGAAGAGDAGNVAVAAIDRLTLEGAGTRIATDTRHSGRGGSIDLAAREIAVGRGALATAASSGAGDSGTISVRASRSLDLAGTLSTDTSGQGNAGGITVTAPMVEVAGGEIRSSSEAGATGRAGNLGISANRLSFRRGGSARVETHDGAGGRIELKTQHLALTGGGTLSTTTRGRGNAGDITLRGAEDVTVSGARSRIALNTEGTGNGGDLKLETERMAVINGGAISATAGAGANAGTRGGNLDLRAAAVRVADRGLISAATSGPGKGGRVSVSARGVDIDEGGEISAATRGAGDAGTVSITSASLRLRGGGKITSAAGSEGGNGGGIDIDTGRLAIADGGGIGATTGGAGRGGTLRIKAGEFSLDSGGSVAAGSSGTGRGGDIRITAGQFTLGPEGTVSATSSGPGKGGDIRVTTGKMEIKDGTLSALSTGAGDAGDITIDAGERLTSDGGRITARADRADGGNISLTARDRIHLVGSEVTTSVGGGVGKGGNLFIDPHWVILDHSRIVANAYGGPGGTIRIVAGQFLRSGDSVVDASSRFGLNGNVLVQSPETNILGKIKALSAHYLDPAALFKTPCAARYAQGESSLAIHTAQVFGPAPGEGLFAASDDSGLAGSALANFSGTLPDSDCALHRTDPYPSDDPD